METKKNSKVNLENFRGMFFLLGLVFSLAIVFATFNQSKADVNISISDENIDVVIDEELVMITKPKLKTPPPPKNQIDQSIIEIVDNKVDLKDFTFKLPDIDDPIDFTDPFIDDLIVDKTDDPIFDYVKVMPIFPGGEPALIAFVAENVDYPAMAIENEIQGTVTMSFVVSKTGKVEQIKVLRGVDPLLDEEAIRVIGTLPNFSPGMSAGRPVNVRMNMPIVFRLY